MRWVLIVVGALMILMGCVWTLQGLDILGTTGQGMTGDKTWAIVGPIVALVGLFAFVSGLRRGRTPTA